MAYDLNVARQAYQTAKSLGASDKVMLALFEAGIVESGMQNLSYGDRDSVGFLQQRAGWGTVAQRMNVVYATTQFVKQAKAVEGRYATAGQLAQGVQRSAFPLKYDQARGSAVALLNQVKGTVSDTPVGPTEPAANVDGSGIGGAVAFLTNPRTWLRLAMIVSGAVLILAAFAMMGWDAAPSGVKKIAKAVITKRVPT